MNSGVDWPPDGRFIISSSDSQIHLGAARPTIISPGPQLPSEQGQDRKDSKGGCRDEGVQPLNAGNQ